MVDVPILSEWARREARISWPTREDLELAPVPASRNV